mmetsp:Transcript_5795/g.15709  ORF Transcript_5795/g.15709 Transcript_5795/m.15709 type:complete len:137 (+) Transcript_5795:240-650(+)
MVTIADGLMKPNNGSRTRTSNSSNTTQHNKQKGRAMVTISAKFNEQRDISRNVSTTNARQHTSISAPTAEEINAHTHQDQPRRQSLLAISQDEQLVYSPPTSTTRSDASFATNFVGCELIAVKVRHPCLRDRPGTV